MQKNKKNKLSEETFNLLQSQTFKSHDLSTASNDVDAMYFHFINSTDVSDFERNKATVTYFCMKKLLQSIKLKCDPENIDTVEVDVSYYC